MPGKDASEENTTKRGEKNAYEKKENVVALKLKYHRKSFLMNNK